MKLSEMEAALATIREQFGDVEINEAVQEYGHKPFTNESFAAFVNFETSMYRDGRPDERNLVMGHH